MFFSAEAQGLNELDSQYWVGDTLSNQKILLDHPLTDEEKRTFALLYGPGGFKPDQRTVRAIDKQNDCCKIKGSSRAKA